MLRSKLALLAIAASLALGAVLPAAAQTPGNSVLWSSRKGDLVFPVTPPTASLPGTVDNMVIGSGTPRPGTFTSLTASGQIISGAGAPSIASGGCGTGTNGSVTGTNQAGAITIGATATTTCQIDFSATLATAPKACVLFPANATAAATGTTVARVSAITTAHFIVTGSALASSNYYFICL